MQAAHYLKSLTEVPVRDAPSAAAPHLYAISNGLAVFALSKRMVREDGQLSAWFELAPTGSGLWVGGTKFVTLFLRLVRRRRRPLRGLLLLLLPFRLLWLLL